MKGRDKGWGYKRLVGKGGGLCEQGARHLKAQIRQGTDRDKMGIRW